LDFQYTALDLSAPTALVFRTKLEGMDADWIDTGASRSAHYSQLPPGDYLFRVMVGGTDGRWYQAAEPLRLIVIPQWWERRWVQVLLGSGLFALGLGAMLWAQKRRARIKLRRVEMERKLEAERSRIARDIHDEMGASLTHIMMLSSLTRNADAQEPNRELDRIHATSRELTRAMDEIVWAVNPRHDTLDSLATYLGRTMQETLRAGGVVCDLDVPVAIPRVQLTSRIRHNLFLAAKEAANNVVKHASATEAVFRLELTEIEFGLILEDNGKGFTPTDDSERNAATSPGRILSGHGLENIRIRSQEAGGRAEIASQAGKGTRLALWIPLSSRT
jgi:signal transduction histidine kinase